MPVLRDRIDDHLKLATEVGHFWLELGALSVTETTEDDVHTSFPMASKLESEWVVFFSWSACRDRTHKDDVIADPRMNLDLSKLHPMNMHRMIWGGFVPKVQLGS